MSTLEPFGAWLLRQHQRTDQIGSLAKAAKADPLFPRGSGPEAVYARLNAREADPDMFEAVEDAESEWRSSGDV